jgi:hypothetical protein
MKLKTLLIVGGCIVAVGIAWAAISSMSTETKDTPTVEPAAITEVEPSE